VTQLGTKQFFFFIRKLEVSGPQFIAAEVNGKEWKFKIIVDHHLI
jgi:hypothetical protein